MSLSNRRLWVTEFIQEHALSQRSACDLMVMSRSQYVYESQKQEDVMLVKALISIKAKHSYYGVPRVLNRLRRQGFEVNGKRVYRLMRSLNLLSKKKKKAKRPFVPPKEDFPVAFHVGEVWSMDFVTDWFANGNPFRCFTIVDVLSREVPGIFASKSMSGFLPVDFLEQLRLSGKVPRHIILDNGPEFANNVLIEWCSKNAVSLHFIDPGKPVQNAYIESFNGKFREEFLNQNSFTSIADVRTKLESWIRYYNEDRPHSSLDYLTPKEFAASQNAMLGRVTASQKNLVVLKTG
jgi:putative transposase